MECSDQVIKKVQTKINGGIDNLEDLHKRLKQCSVQLGRQSSNHKKDDNREIEKKTNVLKEIQQKEGPSDRAMIRQLDNELLELENLKLRQQAKRS